MRLLVWVVGSVLFALQWGACTAAEDSPSMAAPESYLKAAFVENRKPVVENLRLSPISPVSGDRIVASLEASDPDGDSIEVIYQWRLNGRLLDKSESSFYAESLTKGGLIEVTVFARDGKEQSAPIGRG